MSILSTVNDHPLPLDHSAQVSFLQQLEYKLGPIACSEFESTAETAYETKIFPAIFARLRQRPHINVIKHFYRALYDRVRDESMQHSNVIIAWLQPPLSMIETAMLGLEEILVTQYKQMIDSISSSELNVHALCAASTGKLWPRQQAFVIPLNCAIEEFCEFFWRLWQNNTTGKTKHNQTNQSCITKVC
jgi:hypothetical protein